jgi:hypothetical protein
MRFLGLGLLPILLTAEPSARIHFISTPRADSLRVHVCDVDHNPIDQADVEVFDARGHQILAGRTAPDGQIEFSGLDPYRHGDVTVRASKGGLVPERLQLRWTLPPATFSLWKPVDSRGIVSACPPSTYGTVFATPLPSYSMCGPVSNCQPCNPYFSCNVPCTAQATTTFYTVNPSTYCGSYIPPVIPQACTYP